MLRGLNGGCKDQHARLLQAESKPAGCDAVDGKH